jgi:hypothetical protein
MLVYGHPPKPLSETLPNGSQMTPKAAAIQVDKSRTKKWRSPCQPTLRNPVNRVSETLPRFSDQARYGPG